jgi:DNA polymerase elongation subunit (family B)
MKSCSGIIVENKSQIGSKFAGTLCNVTKIHQLYRSMLLSAKKYRSILPHTVDYLLKSAYLKNEDIPYLISICLNKSLITTVLKSHTEVMEIPSTISATLYNNYMSKDISIKDIHFSLSTMNNKSKKMVVSLLMSNFIKDSNVEVVKSLIGLTSSLNITIKDIRPAIYTGEMYDLFLSLYKSAVIAQYSEHISKHVFLVK